MKKKLFTALLLMTVVLGSAVTFTSCRDLRSGQVYHAYTILDVSPAARMNPELAGVPAYVDSRSLTVERVLMTDREAVLVFDSFCYDVLDEFHLMVQPARDTWIEVGLVNEFGDLVASNIIEWE